MRCQKIEKKNDYIAPLYGKHIFTNLCTIVIVPHDPKVAQPTYNGNDFRFLDHYVHPMCYVMDVMTNLRQYY